MVHSNSRTFYNRNRGIVSTLHSNPDFSTIFAAGSYDGSIHIYDDESCSSLLEVEVLYCRFVAADYYIIVNLEALAWGHPSSVFNGWKISLYSSAKRSLDTLLGYSQYRRNANEVRSSFINEPKGIV